MQESKEPIEFTETSRPDDELDVQEEVTDFQTDCAYYLQDTAGFISLPVV